MRRTLDLPAYLVRDACLYAPGRSDLDAVCHVLADYPRLVSELRQIRRQLDDLSNDYSDFDSRLDALQRACRAILDL